MLPPRDESTLGRAMDRLLDCGSQVERARILLDAVLDEELATAAGLWRRVGQGPVRAWHPVVSRGPASCLPTLGQVEAVVDGRLDAELPLRGVVLTPAEDEDFALALGEVEASADRLAELEGLLSVWAAIERAERAFPDELIDAVSAPTPTGQDLIDADLGESLDELRELLGRSADQEPELVRSSPGSMLEDLLEYELARRLGPESEVRWRTDGTPRLGLDEEQLDDLVQNLLDGQAEAARRVRVELEPSGPELPGALLVLEFDCGWPPGLGGSHLSPGPGPGLSLAMAELAAHGGSLGLERGSWGGLRLTVWLPAAADPSA